MLFSLWRQQQRSYTENKHIKARKGNNPWLVFTYLSWMSLKFWKKRQIHCEVGTFFWTTIKKLTTELYTPSAAPYLLPLAAPVWLRWSRWATALLLKAPSSYPSFPPSSPLLPSSPLRFFLTPPGGGPDGAARTDSWSTSVFPATDSEGDYCKCREFFLFDQTRYSFCNPKPNIITDHLIAGYLDVLEQVRGGQVNSFEGFQFILQALER